MKCPGQDTRYWKPGDIFEIDCPHCADKVEFFKDEATRRCRTCRNVIANPKMDFGCASYCQYAAQCLGELGPDLRAKRNDLLKDRVAVEVKRSLGKDFQKIGHVGRVARFAEEVGLGEKAEPAPVLCAAYLHIFPESETEGKSAAGRQTARDILERLGAGPELTGRILEIIDLFVSGNAGDSVNGKIFFDAHFLASLEEKGQGGGEVERGVEDIGGKCLTETGKKLASIHLN